MAAIIRTTLLTAPAGPVVGPVLTSQSRDDLRKGYQVFLEAVDPATTYAWQISFTPQSTGGGLDPLEGSASTATLLPPEGAISSTARFNVDNEGAYLIRLVVDMGLPTESTQFIRLRYLTQFGDLKLVAAGERRDQNGVIPVDADPEGWSNDQNRNLQRLASFVRRLSTTGRSLYVDANKGRNSALAANDPDNLVSFPGWDASDLSGTGIEAGAEAFGDFSTITDAIAYAQTAAGRGEPAPSATEPYFIFVQPGLYVEDLQLASHVHLVGLGSTPKLAQLQQFDVGGTLDLLAKQCVVVQALNSGGLTLTYSPAGDPTLDMVSLQNLLLTNTAATSAPLLKHEGGLLLLDQCVLLQQGNDAAQGAAFSSVTSSLVTRPACLVENTTIWSMATGAGLYAVVLNAPKSNYIFRNSTLVGAAACLSYNEGLYGGLVLGDPNDSTLDVRDSTLAAQGITDYCFRGFGTNQSFDRCSLSSIDLTKTFSVDSFGGGAGAKLGDVSVVLTASRVFGDVLFDTTSVTGSSSIEFGTTSMLGTLSFPGGSPTSVNAGAHAKSLTYQNDYANPVSGAPVLPVLSRLGVNNVQDAIDLLVQLLLPLGSAPHLSLESAYNGLATLNPPLAGAGLGRRIPADSGAVEITEATVPVGSSISGLDPANYNGWLKVEGGQDLGGLVTDGQGSEISLDPNAMGTGPMIRLGRNVYADDAGSQHRGINAALFLAGAQANTNRYNLRFRTRDASTSGTGTTGNSILEAGTSLAPVGGGASPDAGHVFLDAGNYRNATAGGLPGEVFITPGTSDAGDPDGRLRLVLGATATPTTLEALNVFVGGVTGTVTFATPNGYVNVAVDAADSAAVVAGKISDAEGLQGSLALGKLLITTDLTGPNADVHYVGDDQSGALNTALGELRVNSGAILTLGTYPDTVGLYCQANGVLGIDGTIFGMSAPQFTRIAITNADSVFTLSPAYSIIGCNSNGGPIRIVLPNSTAAGATEGRLIFINDEAQAAGVGKEIYIDVGAALPYGLIDNTMRGLNAPGVSLVMGSPGSGVMLYCAGETRIVDTYVINAGGSGYFLGEVVTLDGGTGQPATFVVASLGGGGAIATLTRTKPGLYTVDPLTVNVTLNGGSGTSATVDVTLETVAAWYQVP